MARPHAVKETGAAQYLAVTGSSGKFTTAMREGELYEFVANADCWVAVEATGGAAAADEDTNILYVGQKLYLSAPDGTNNFVHVISDGINCDACLYLVA